MELKELEWFRDDHTLDLDFEIAVAYEEVRYLMELLEDLREAIVCKPLQYKRLLGQLEKQINEVCMRVGYLINSLKKEVGDQQWH